MPMNKLDNEAATIDLTSSATIFTDTPDASNDILCQALAKFGSGDHLLSATGGDFELVIMVDGVTIEPSPQTITFSGATSAGVWTTPFPVPANEEVIIAAKSPNTGDSSVIVKSYLYDIMPVVINASGAVNLSSTTETQIDDIETAIITNAAATDISYDIIAMAADVTNIETDTQDIQSRLPSSLINGRMSSDLAAISSDATAADNLEAMYDGTGYNDLFAPAQQQQLANIVVSSAAINSKVEVDNTGAAIKDVSFVGTQTGTYTNTEALDGVYHKIDDTGDAIDIVYGFDIGGDGVPTGFSMFGFLNGQGDSLKISAYDFAGSSWTQIGNIIGSNATVNEPYSYNLYTSMVGTGADLGKAYLRFHNTGQSNPDLNIDQLYISYSIVRRSVGYSNGSIWVDTNNGMSGHENYVNGTADNPVSTWADALLLSASMSIKNFNIINGSSVTLSATSDNFTIAGCEYDLDLGGQPITNAHIEGAVVTGTGTTSGDEMHFEQCHIGTCSIGESHFSDCGFTGAATTTFLAAGTYTLDKCYSAGGASPPVLDFGGAVGSTILGLRDWTGGVKIKNLGASGTDKLTIQGAGSLTIDSSCSSGTIGLHGPIIITDNVDGGFSGTINEDSRYDVDQITAAVLDDSVKINGATLNVLSGHDPGATLIGTVSEGGYDLQEMIRIISAALAGKSSGGGSSEITFRDLNDTKDRIVATVSASGNRTAVTLDAS